MTYTITALKALQDNYIWVIHNEKNAIVVDPTLADPVRKFLDENQLALSAIILTHGHQDHIGGVAELVQQFNPEVIDNFCDQLQDGQEIVIGDFPAIKVFLTPGHVYEHVCYLLDGKHLFCGDTLFSLGCGRVFTGDYQVMYQSLAKLKQLPPEVKCYPAHEYTRTNLNFTLGLDNKNVEYYADLVTDINYKLATVGNSLPTTIGIELKYNLFLRDNEETLWQLIANHANADVNNGFDYFYNLRLIRNSF